MKTQSNPKILCDIISQKMQTASKREVLEEIGKVDEQLSKIYGRLDSPSLTIQDFAMSNRSFSNSTLGSTVALGIPKTHSLTDSLMRSTLGCEQKLAKSYIEILKETEEEDVSMKQEQAKKIYASTNPYESSQANSKPLFNSSAKAYLRKGKPVIDNEHDSYLKTQLIYMQKMKSSKVEDKEYYDKHMDKTARKIKQIGGIEDTIGPMEESLRRNELKSKDIWNYSAHNPTPSASVSRLKERKSSWVDKSRAVRETLIASMSMT